MTGPAGPTDTIYALSSGQPPAAVAVIRSSGPGASAAAETLAGTLPLPRKASVRTLRDPDTAIVLDQVLVLRFDAPASSTGEDVVEYQCHGGRAVVRSILDAISTLPGMRAAEPGEFTRRAFLNGRIDLTEAEGLADLLEAETERQRRAALLSAEGGVRRLVEGYRERIVILSARAEAAIDYVDDEGVTSADTVIFAAEARSIADELDQWLAKPRAEPLRQGIRVVAAGPPNAGKSSLINVLSQCDRAIVTNIPGTTRDVIEVPVAIAGIPFVLVDTAGLRDGRDAVERIGIVRAEAELSRADLLLWLGSANDVPDHPRLMRLHPRCDEQGRCEPVGNDTLAVSSFTGEGIDRLTEWLIVQATSLLPGEGELALNDRQAAGLAIARDALGSALVDDVVLVAESLRQAREAMDRVTGRAGLEDMLDGLFGRFCIGK